MTTLNPASKQDEHRPSHPPNPSSTAQHDVDQLFKKWSRHIANTFTNKYDRTRRDGNIERGEGDEVSKLDLTKPIEIERSVFEPESTAKADGDGIEEEVKKREMGPEGQAELQTLDHNPPLSHEEFDQLVEEVRSAIASDIHPKLNSKGSSGSYFALSPSRQTLGIFKPSDEDPYGSHNPKLLKYIHRQLHHISPSIIPFGRSCLIPGQSYVSESAASLLDRKLESYIVPRTEVVGLTSKAFHFDWIDRERAKKSGNWRVKEGSFQVFMKGFTDASDFFLKHPYPPTSTTRTPSSSSLSSSQRKRRRRARCLSPTLLCCGRASSASDSDSDLDDDETTPQPRSPASTRIESFEWTPEMVDSFKLELEKLVILDFLIRNTDRGLDNFMIKPCLSPPSCSSPTSPTSDSEFRPHLHLAAIDNSLAFPHTHPQGWRTFPYGWLYLPLQLLDHPWSKETREWYLKKLEDRIWWSELGKEMRSEFVRDCQGKEEETEKAWRKQWSVVKGQGWNLVQSLRNENEGPLELCRRSKVLVWDDYVLVRDNETTHELPPNAKPTANYPIPSADHSFSPIPTTSYSVSYNRSPLPSPSPAKASFQRPNPPALAHRRTLSDYTQPTYKYGSFSTSTNRGANPRSSSFLRKPLDDLSSLPTRSIAGKLFRHSSSSSSVSRAPSDQAGGDGIDDETEETGYSFLRRLDRIEKDEMKRAKKVMKDAKKLGLIENGTANDRNVKQGEDERTRLLSTANERAEVDNSDSEEEDYEEVQNGGHQWGTASEIVFSENGNGGVGPDRMAASWHQANRREMEMRPESDETGAALDRNGQEAGSRKKMKWVIHERLEYVEEPKRRFKFW